MLNNIIDYIELLWGISIALVAVIGFAVSISPRFSKALGMAHRKISGTKKHTRKIKSVALPASEEDFSGPVVTFTGYGGDGVYMNGVKIDT